MTVVLDEESPPPGWNPSDEDVKRMRLTRPLDPDAHLDAAASTIQAAETWFQTLRGPSPLEEVLALLQTLDQKVEHSVKRLEGRLVEIERNLAVAEGHRASAAASALGAYAPRSAPAAPPVAPTRAPVATTRPTKSPK